MVTGRGRCVILRQAGEGLSPLSGETASRKPSREVETAVAQFSLATSVDILGAPARSERDRLLLVAFLGIVVSTVATVDCELSMAGLKLTFAPIVLPISLLLIVGYYSAAFGVLAWTDLRKYGALSKSESLALEQKAGELRQQLADIEFAHQSRVASRKRITELRDAYQAKRASLEPLNKAREDDPDNEDDRQAQLVAELDALDGSEPEWKAYWHAVTQSWQEDATRNDIELRIKAENAFIRKVLDQQEMPYRIGKAVALAVPALVATVALILLGSLIVRIALYAAPAAACTPRKAAELLMTPPAVVGRPDSIDRLRKLSQEHVARSHTEGGCEDHAVDIDTETPLRLMFVERWRDRQVGG
jgi:hypothetical protein